MGLRRLLKRVSSKVFHNPSITAENYSVVRNSVLFDKKYYLDSNLDIKAAKADPVLHYLLFGGSEGRNPGPDFSTQKYLDENPDVAGAGFNALVHFELFGREEGRKTRPVIDSGAGANCRVAEPTSSQRPASDSAQRVADFWATDHKIDRPQSWLEHPVFLRLVHERVTENGDVNGIQWFQENYLSGPVDAALSLGCGLGAFERDAIRMNIAERFTACDISAGAIETARTEAARAGMGKIISYDVLDLDTDELPPAAYGVVFGLMCIHHILDLDHAFEQIHRSLKPGGLLYIDEYIGPRQFQTEPNVTAIINRELASLPESYRRSLFINGHVVNTYTPSPISHFEQTDPSEAIRSDEIVEKLAKRFDILEFRPYGGAILHMLLHGIAGNFSPEKPEDLAMMHRLFALERELEDAGQIQSDFAVIVARPK